MSNTDTEGLCERLKALHENYVSTEIDITQKTIFSETATTIRGQSQLIGEMREGLDYARHSIAGLGTLLEAVTAHKSLTVETHLERLDALLQKIDHQGDAR